MKAGCCRWRLTWQDLVFGIFATLLLGSLSHGAPTLAIPVDCEIGNACIVQNYVDHAL